MFSIPEQFSAASNAHYNAQLAVINALTSKAFEGVEKLVDLNLSLAKSSLEESNAAVKQLLTAKDAQEWLSLSAAHLQPNTEKALAYSRQVADIASGLQAEITRTAETQIAENSRKLLELVEGMTKNAPAGSENAVAFLKSLIGNINLGYEQLNKTGKQAVETLEANMNAAANQFVQPAAAKAAGRASKK
jgi:phasin family protein